MILATAAATYMLGLRHGSDPDHVSAIDTLTRSSVRRAPRLSGIVGGLFALGHIASVFSIALLVHYLTSLFAGRGTLIETIGTRISILVLLALAALNLSQMSRTGTASGWRARLLPRRVREAGCAWLAFPVGVLFGLGFETPSQLSALALSTSAQNGVAGAMIVACAFRAVMISTDLLDSLLVSRLIVSSYSRIALMRAWCKDSQTGTWIN